MKTRCYSLFQLLMLTLVALLPVNLQSATQIVTNWVAYNDHRPGPAPTPTAWGTAPNVNPYDMRVGPGGNLVDFLTGQPLPAMLNVTPNGAPDDFPTCVEPNINSPAGKLFFGVVDVANTSSTIGVRYSADTYVTLTFTGLDPEKHYVFRGTGVRGGSYPLRWSVATIMGTRGFIDAHSTGVLTANDFPASLEPGQAAWNSGDNRAGAVVGWDFITPAEDGSFSIISSNYVGQITGGTADSTVYGYAISAMLLAEVEAAAPAISSQPVAQTTVEQNRPFNLSVTASGTPLFYQWYKEGAAISGATLATYSVAKAAAADQANYRVVVSNPLGSVTSSVAHVTVNADTTAPIPTTVFTYPQVDPASQIATLDQLIIEYNEEIDPVSAVVAGNYQLSVGGAPSLVILTNERSVVLKLAAPLAEDTPYTVRIIGVRDLVGNATSASSPGNPASFRSWARGPGNGLLLEAYNTGPGIEVVNLTSSPLFPDSPSLRTNLYAFDTRIAFPDDSVEAYGVRVSGVFIPPVSGNWIFHLRTFDRGELYLNPEGLDPAGKRLLVAETTGNNPRDWNKLLSDPISLRAGQGYYIEGLMKADVGVDVIKVAARLAGSPLPPLGVPDAQVDPSSMTGAYIASPLAPRDLGGALAIAQDLADVTAEELHPATLSVKVSNPSGLPVFYQWFRDGTLIDGATGPSYSFPATLLDSGATFRVEMSKIGSVAPVVSRTAKLTVVQDVTKPRVLKVVSSALDLSTVVVHFSEAMAPGTADDRLNYSVTGVGVLGAVIQPGGTNVTLTLESPLTLYSSYQLEVIASLDLVGLDLDPTPTLVSFVAGGAPPLSISRAGSQVTLAWPDLATGFTLQEAPALASPPNNSAWATVATAPIVANGQFIVTLTVGTGNKIYRLTR
jgi:hypothetical protein